MAIDYDPIIPSSLLSLNNPHFDSSLREFADFSLKTGVILKTYYIEDPLNVSKKYTEYDVLVSTQDGGMGAAAIIYKKCFALESFGSVSDFFESSLRQPTKDPLYKNSETNKIEPYSADGAIVLVLCINGQSDQGVIIGAIKHPNRNTVLTKEKGHHLEGEFNGVNWQINKDGELVVTFKSPTDNEGKYLNEEAGGSTVKLEKDGSIEISDGTTEKIKLDKTAKSVSIESETEFSLKTKDIKIEAQNNIEIKAVKDLIAEAEGKATMSFKESFELKVDGETKVKSKSFDLKADSKVEVKSSQITLDGNMINVGQGGQPAVVMTTQFMGIGNLGGIVISTAIGPFSSKVFIAP